jgi:hypothetical protein
VCDLGLARSLYVEEDVEPEPEEVRDSLGVAGRHAGPAGMEEDAHHGAGVGSAMESSSHAGGGDTPHGSTGSAASVASPGAELSRVMTRHVVTRWYRSPELPLYNDGVYTTAIDLWSVGCCYAEMLGMLDNGPESRYERKALFPGGSCAPMSRDKTGGKDKSGKEKKDQLSVIFDVLGTPTEDELSRIRTAAAREYVMSVKPRRPEDLAKRYAAATPEALDLLHQFLRFHPEDRISVEGALAHPFLAPVRRPQDEVRACLRSQQADRCRACPTSLPRCVCCVDGVLPRRPAFVRVAVRDACERAAASRLTLSAALPSLLPRGGEGRAGCLQPSTPALPPSLLALPSLLPRLQLNRKEGPIPFRRATPENIRELFVDEIRHYNLQIPDNWKELAAAGAYEWRLLMESGAYDDVLAEGGADPYAAGGGGGYEAGSN